MARRHQHGALPGAPCLQMMSKRAGKEWLGGFHDTGESHQFTTGERVVVYTSLREDMPMRFAIALIAALAASSHSSAQEPVLDLLAPRADNDTRSAGDLLSVPGGVIGVVGQHQPLLSLRLTSRRSIEAPIG
jgi:hypothetical protein